MESIKNELFKKLEQFKLDKSRLKEIKGGYMYEAGTWISSNTFCQGDTWINQQGRTQVFYAPNPITSVGLCNYAGDIA